MGQVSMNPTVLVVDDHADVRHANRLGLQSHGYTVHEAQSGEEALEYLKNNTPAVILLDIMMPGMDGLEVLKRIRTNPATAKIPVILLTARAGDRDRLAGYQYEADHYITKPCPPARLREVIAALIEKSRE